MSLRAKRSNLFEIVVNSKGWLTGNILLPALRAHYVRPNSLPANLSLGFALLAMTLALFITGRPPRPRLPLFAFYPRHFSTVGGT